jgi:hypothetical protein
MIITDIANAVPILWNFSTGIHKDFVNKYGFLHACYFEARLNLDLIGSIKMDAINGTEGTAAFAELVNSFETSAILAMVAGSNRSEYNKMVKLLAKRWQPPTGIESEEPDDKDKDKDIKDVLENFSFAARKIEALRRISRIAGKKDAEFLNSLRLKVRLENIKLALLSIAVCLRNVIDENEM